MRVITGSAKGKRLKFIKNIKLRPTTSKVKEAIFSIIQFYINSSCQVLDLFAGSGQLGIEALSRGAKKCIFVDKSSISHKIQIQNLKSTNLSKNAEVILADSIYFLKKTQYKYNIIFLDPPYDTDLSKKALYIAQFKLYPNGIIICEHSKYFNVDDNFENISLQKRYDYGKISLSFYRKKD